MRCYCSVSTPQLRGAANRGWATLRPIPSLTVGLRAFQRPTAGAHVAHLGRARVEAPPARTRQTHNRHARDRGAAPMAPAASAACRELSI
jgi:hypothetical protein